ncbi:MAG: hypothetical protein ACRD08_23345 [Acidimicrobiales bacterium]
MRKPNLFVLAALAGAAALACQDTIVKYLGPENREVETVVTDSLRFQAFDLDNVHDTRVWTWTNTGTVALVHHSSFVHHGVARLTILDAAGDTVYRFVPLEYELDNETTAGVAGAWTVTLELFGARGRVDFSIVRKP